MAPAIRITYLENSGFAVVAPDALLIFDDARGRPPAGTNLEQGWVTDELIAGSPRTIVFVSHSHADHFQEDIYAWAGAGQVEYVLGDDLPAKYKGRRMSPGNIVQLGDYTITAHASTDAGVSFLVRHPDFTIFHAGDLNFWHWRDESTLKEIERAEQDFHEAVAPLVGLPIDIAFFPVDPRQGSLYDAGALHFAMHVKPRVFIPMHFQGRADVAVDFVRRNRTRKVEMVALTQPGETLVANRQEADKWQMYVIVPDPAGAQAPFKRAIEDDATKEE